MRKDKKKKKLGISMSVSINSAYSSVISQKMTIFQECTEAEISSFDGTPPIGNCPIRNSPIRNYFASPPMTPSIHKKVPNRMVPNRGCSPLLIYYKMNIIEFYGCTATMVAAECMAVAECTGAEISYFAIRHVLRKNRVFFFYRGGWYPRS